MAVLSFYAEPHFSQYRNLVRNKIENSNDADVRSVLLHRDMTTRERFKLTVSYLRNAPNDILGSGIPNLRLPLEIRDVSRLGVIADLPIPLRLDNELNGIDTHFFSPEMEPQYFLSQAPLPKKVQSGSWVTNNYSHLPSCVSSLIRFEDGRFGLLGTAHGFVPDPSIEETKILFDGEPIATSGNRFSLYTKKQDLAIATLDDDFSIQRLSCRQIHSRVCVSEITKGDWDMKVEKYSPVTLHVKGAIKGLATVNLPGWDHAFELFQVKPQYVGDEVGRPGDSGALFYTYKNGVAQAVGIYVSGDSYQEPGKANEFGLLAPLDNLYADFADQGFKFRLAKPGDIPEIG